MENKYREILVATVGLTPETVTETIYYYHKQFGESRFFSDYRLITTETGKRSIIKTLFIDGWLNKLEKALDLEPNSIPLDENSIIVIKDKSGNPLEDIRTTENANIERLTLFKLFQDITQDELNRLTVSIAGGRKTMSASIALALQIYGREQDELIHVMVPESKRQENTKEPWFFPQNEDEIIEVSRLPIIKTRKLMGNNLPIDVPDKMLDIAQTRLDELAPLDSVIIDKNMFVINSNEIKISPISMMIWRYLARNKLEGCKTDPSMLCSGCSSCYVSHNIMIDDLNNKMLKEYGIILGEKSEQYIDLKDRLTNLEGNNHSYEDKSRNIRQYLYKLKTQLKTNIHQYGIRNALMPKVIEDEDGMTLHGLNITREAIIFKD